MLDQPSTSARSSLLEAASGLSARGAGVWSAHGSTSSAFSADSHDFCFRAEAESFWFEHRNRCIVSLVRRYPPRGAILDVGGGNGYVTHGLRGAGFDAVVLEPGEAGAHNAARRGLTPVIHATLEGAAFRAGSLPAVGLFDVLEHVADARSFLGRIGELLTPGGTLYLTVPAFETLWSSEDVAAGHYRRYTKGSLRKELADSGFAIDFETYFFVLLPLPIFFLRKLPELFGAKRAADASASDHVARGRFRAGLMALLSLESTLIEAGRRLPIGASLLVAAHRREGPG